MTTKKSNKKTTNETILASTTEDVKQDQLTGADVVYVSCGIRGDHKFDDLGANGMGVYILPGMDSHLRGQKSGILTPDGNAIMIQLKRSVWEEILAKHGQERMFKGDGVHAPLVFEVGSKDDFRARRDEIATSITGLAPKDLNSLNVAEA